MWPISISLSVSVLKAGTLRQCCDCSSSVEKTKSCYLQRILLQVDFFILAGSIIKLCVREISINNIKQIKKESHYGGYEKGFLLLTYTVID